MVMSPKTKYVVFNISKELYLQPQLMYHDLSCLEEFDCTCPTIEQVLEMKYLGLVLDSRVSWKQHIDYLKKKLIKYLQIFYLLRSVCDEELMKSVYYSLINSKLEYGIGIWGGTFITALKPIILLQMTFVRIVAGKSKYEHSEPIFKQLAILPFKNLSVYSVLRIYFNRSGTKHGILYKPRRENLRNCFSVNVPKPNLSQFMKFYSFLAPKFFHLLPTEIKLCKTQNHFNRSVKKLLLETIDIETFYKILQWILRNVLLKLW